MILDIVVAIFIASIWGMFVYKQKRKQRRMKRLFARYYRN